VDDLPPATDEPREPREPRDPASHDAPPALGASVGIGPEGRDRVSLADSVSRRPLIIRVLEGTADVYINDVRVGVTPYTLTAPIGTEVQLMLRREGCDDLRRPLRLEEGMQETVESLSGCRRR